MDLTAIIRRDWSDETRKSREGLMEDEFWIPHIREAGLGLDDPFTGSPPQELPPLKLKEEAKPVLTRSEALRADWPYMSRREREAVLTGQIREYWAPIVREAGVSLKDPHLRRPKPPKPTPEEIAAAEEEWRRSEQEIVDRGLTPFLIDSVRNSWPNTARGGRKWMMTQPSHAMVVEALGLKMTDRYVSMAEEERRLEREEEKERQRQEIEPPTEPPLSDEDADRILIDLIHRRWPHMSAAEREEGQADPAWGPYIQKAGVALDAPYLGEPTENEKTQ